MNNLPSNMGRDTVFRDNTYTNVFIFPENYPVPAANLIKMQVRYNGRILTDITPTISVSGQRVTCVYSSEQLAKVPSIVQQYLNLDGVSLIGGELGVLVGYGEQNITEREVIITDGEVKVIEVMGLDLVTAQVTIATEKAEQTAADRIQTGQDVVTTTTQAGIATSGANTATTKAGEAAGSATAAGNAQAGAEAARDETVQLLAQKMDFFSVNTYAALQAFIADPELGPCAIMVFFDETYGGLPRLHIYTGDVPVLGPKLIQFVTYTE